MATRNLFHVSMIIDATGLHAVSTVAATHKAQNVEIKPVVIGNGEMPEGIGASGRTPQTTARTFMLEWMKTNLTFTTGEAVKAAEERGMSRSSVYTFINVAVNREKLLKRTAAGTFKVTQKGEMALLTPAQQRATRGNGGNGLHKTPAKPNEVTHRQFILRAAKRRDQISYTELREKFREDGRNPKSVDGALGKLKDQKLITNVGPGAYKLTAKGQEA